MCLTHLARAEFWQVFSTQDTPVTGLLKGKSHLGIYCSQITVLQFGARMSYDQHRRLVISSRSVMHYGGRHQQFKFYCSLLFWIQLVLSCQQL